MAKLRRGVTQRGDKRAKSRLDFDMHTTLLPAPVVFPHQKRWTGKLSPDDITELRSSPFRNMTQLFERFEPEVQFSLDAELRDELLEEMKEAGVSAAEGKALQGAWKVRGTVRKLADFSPAQIAAGGENWDENILQYLGRLDKMLARLAAEASEIEFDEQEELVEALDLLIEVLSESDA